MQKLEIDNTKLAKITHDITEIMEKENLRELDVILILAGASHYFTSHRIAGKILGGRHND